MRCEICEKFIKIEDYINPEEFTKERLQSLENLTNQFNTDIFSAHFVCTICSESVLVSESITLSCIHRYCISCFKDFITDIIKENRLKELKCPTCQGDITYDEIRANVDKTVFELYTVLTTRNYKPDNPNYFLKECFICASFFEIPRNLEVFTCPNCKSKYCPNCNSNHPRQTCAEFLSKNPPTIFDNQYVHCPKCKEAFKRLDGNKGCTCKYCSHAWMIYIMELCLSELQDHLATMSSKDVTEHRGLGEDCAMLDSPFSGSF